MKQFLTIASDVQAVGAPWQGNVTRYNAAGFQWHPDGTTVLSDIEGLTHFNLRREVAFWSIHKTAKAKVAAFHAETRLLVPPGTLLIPYATPATWKLGWTELPADEQAADVAHWVGIFQDCFPPADLANTAVGSQVYRIHDAPNPADAQWLIDRLTLGCRVADALGRPLAAIIHHRTPTGRALTEPEILELCGPVRQLADIVAFWSSDHSGTTNLTSKKYTDAAIAAQAAKRLAVQSEVWGTLPPVWHPAAKDLINHQFLNTRREFCALVEKAMYA